MEEKSSLEKIKKIQKEIILIGQALSLLEWDKSVYMPENAAESRGEQSAILSKLIHEKITSPELSSLLEEVNLDSLSEIDLIMIKRLKHDVGKEAKLPSEFVEELSRETVKGFSMWKKARDEKDFSVFKDSLKRIVELKRKEAEYIGLEGHPYNSLIDNYEEGMTVEKLSPIFQELKRGLLELIKKIESSSKYGSKDLSFDEKDEFPYESQVALAKDVFRRIVPDEKNSRIDFSEHPFEEYFGRNDVRITTNVREEDPLFSFTSTTHESGHALYELDIPKKFEYTVLRDSPSFGLHESQSIFWERMVGRSESFWKFYFEKFKDKFTIKENSDDFYKKVNKVSPGLIRIESDEVHYCLHIILRFEVEKGLIDGSIEVEDLPTIWNEKMKEYFGIEPKNDKEGVLQDVHWCQGDFGYFPSYAIGSVYSSQIYLALKKDLPDINQDILKGDFSRIRNWLNENVHKYGRTLLAEETMKKICGEGLNQKVYLQHLEEKYSKLYGF